MPQLKIILDGDGCWNDIPELQQSGRLIDCMGNDAPPLQIAALSGGMASGRVSVTIRIDLPDQRVLFTETSLALLKTAIDAFTARHEPDSQKMQTLTEASMALHKFAEAAGRPIVFACHPDQISPNGFLYNGYSGEVRPGVEGLTIAHRCDADEAQDIIDLLEKYWQRKRNSGKGFGKQGGKA